MILNTPNANIGSLKSRLHKVAQVLEEFIEEIENSPVPCACSYLENAAAFETASAICETDEWLVLGSATNENDYFEGTAVSILDENYVFNPSLATGDFEIKHIVLDGVCEDVATQNITVFGLAAAGFNDLSENYTTADEAVTLVPNSDIGEHIFVGEGVVEGVFYPNLVNTLNESITITHIVTNELCTDSTSQNIVVGFPVGLENIAENEVAIYPTISRNAIFIDAAHLKIETIELFDITGKNRNHQIVLEEMKTNATYKIDISKLQSACYVLRIGTENAFFSKKIIVCD